MAVKILHDKFGITSYSRPDQMPVTPGKEDDGVMEINIGVGKVKYFKDL